MLLAIAVGAVAWASFHYAKDLQGAVHIALPLFVIIVESFSLYMMTRETRSRTKVMEDLNAFRISLGRAHYMREIQAAIQDADNEVVFTSATMAASWREEAQGSVLQAVLKREERNGQGYDHRGLVAKAPGVLPGMLELLSKTKVQVRVTPVVEISRLRFLVRDKRYSVIGVAEGPASLDGHRPTQSSFSVDSTMLGCALVARFDLVFEQAQDPWLYIDELISAFRQSHNKYSRGDFLRLIGSPKDGIREELLLDKCVQYRDLVP